MILELQSASYIAEVETNTTINRGWCGPEIMDPWVPFVAWKGMWTEMIMQTECMDSWVMCVAKKGMWTEINCDLVRFSPSDHADRVHGLLGHVCSMEGYVDRDQL